jgi:glycerol-3-phosphate dehydrogenase
VVPVYDLAIVGGGINGCGIARDAAGRGLAVYLCEMDDLASGTSSRSTKLIHGGLRYLEYYDFRLVREALREREVLWRIAPHVIRPMRIVLPYRRGLRPVWMLRFGLLLYDYLGGRELLPPTRVLDLTRDRAGAPLKPGIFRTAFEYSDCRVDDARLVAINARDAAEHGATIRTRTKAVAAVRRDSVWDVTVEDLCSGQRETIAARALVNAAGPWVAQTLASCLGLGTRQHGRLVQGSHIVVPQLFEHDRSYMFQNPDGRIVFAIPYEGATTLIGTTDRDYAGDPGGAVATPEDILYLCNAVSDYFTRPVSPADVVWSFSGVARSTMILSASPKRRRATTCWSWMRRKGAHHCCRCSAARSQPTGGSRRRPSTGSISGDTPAGRNTRPCPAAILRWTGSRRLPARSRLNFHFSLRRMQAGLPRPMARGPDTFWQVPARRRISESSSARRSRRPKCNI